MTQFWRENARNTTQGTQTALLTLSGIATIDDIIRLATGTSNPGIFLIDLSFGAAVALTIFIFKCAVHRNSHKNQDSHAAIYNFSREYGGGIALGIAGVIYGAIGLALLAANDPISIAFYSIVLALGLISAVAATSMPMEQPSTLPVPDL